MRRLGWHVSNVALCVVCAIGLATAPAAHAFLGQGAAIRRREWREPFYAAVDANLGRYG